MKKIFIDEEIRVFENDSAQKKLNEINDSKFFDEKEGGVHKVDIKRWSSAQKYEKKTWVSHPHLSDDRNIEHFDRFNKLSSLLDIPKNCKVIELGCGPFTNLRLMSTILKPQEITLLDPLINEYLKLPNCGYKEYFLNGIKVNTINSPIENYQTDEKFDVVIMINVIEHCYDVDLIFDTIEKILKDGGILIFSDVFFEDVKNMVYNSYDAGHPIKLSKNKIENFISKFKTIFDKRFHGLYNQDWRNDLYFIGIK